MPDWGLVAKSGGAAVAVVALFWLALEHAGTAPPRRRNPLRLNPAPMRVQSLLFARSAWSPARAKAWARSHGYLASKVDVTERHVRLRQSPPSGKHVFRTVRFGKGISAVVAR